VISAPHISSVIPLGASGILSKFATSGLLGSVGLTLARLSLLADLGKRIWQRNFHIDQTRRGKMTAVGPRWLASRRHPIS
jgi:hypothetical protein